MGASDPGRAEGGLAAAVWSALALLGLAGLAGVAHSWLDPVYLTRVSREDAVRAVGDPAPGVSPSASPGTDEDPSGTPDPGLQPDVVPAPPDGGDAAAGSVRSDGLRVLEGDRVDLAEARRLYGEGVPFIDAREEEAYRAGHVMGAFPLSVRQMGSNTQNLTMLLQYFDPTQTVVIYCTGGTCDDAENVRLRLENEHGFQDVLVMQAGYQDWADAGAPTETGNPWFGEDAP